MTKIKINYKISGIPLNEYMGVPNTKIINRRKYTLSVDAYTTMREARQDVENARISHKGASSKVVQRVVPVARGNRTFYLIYYAFV